MDNILTLPGFTATDVEKLREANIPTLATLASTSKRKLLTIRGFSESKVCVSAVVVVRPPAHHRLFNAFHPPAHPLTYLRAPRVRSHPTHTRTHARPHTHFEVIKLKDACKELAKRGMFIRGSTFMTGNCVLVSRFKPASLSVHVSTPTPHYT